MGTQMKFQGMKYQEIKVMIFHMNILCKVNCLKRLSDNQYAVVSQDFLYKDEPLKDIKFKKQNYYELVEEEFKNSFLEWSPSLDQAIDTFMAGFFL
ncbi:hypothetical protein PT286_10175 [Neisseriaceae bacterium ESL0693]|nr:hypothetical protein [Neisseriaceae bacterium ESL0693]